MKHILPKLVLVFLGAFFFFATGAFTAYAAIIAHQDISTNLSNDRNGAQIIQTIGNGYTHIPTTLSVKIKKSSVNSSALYGFVACWNEATYTTICNDQPDWRLGFFLQSDNTIATTSTNPITLTFTFNRSITDPIALRPNKYYKIGVGTLSGNNANDAYGSATDVFPSGAASNASPLKDIYFLLEGDIPDPVVEPPLDPGASSIADQRVSENLSLGTSNFRQGIGGGFNQTPTRLTFRIRKQNGNQTNVSALLLCYNDAAYTSTCSDQPGWTFGWIYVEQDYVVSGRGNHFLSIPLTSPGMLRPDNYYKVVLICRTGNCDWRTYGSTADVYASGAAEGGASSLADVYFRLEGIAPSVNHPPTLSFPSTGPYTEDGLDPNKGTANVTPFSFKITYADADNDPPSTVAVVIDDGATTTRSSMVIDTNSVETLHDGTYTNGEQYVFSATFPQGEYRYHFEARGATTTATTTTRLPALGERSFSAGYSSVAFLPGIEASRLYRRDPGCLFINCENQLWEPNRNADVEKLYLNEQGESIEPGIYTRDVIDEAFGFNIYKKFMGSLDVLVADEVIAQWRAYPYDWRRNIEDVIQSGTLVKEGGEFQIKHMADELVALASTSKSGKVTVIGHSNGGLVGKLLIDELERRGQANLVDTFIMAAVPQLGTPAALIGMLHGDNQVIPKVFPIILDKSDARELAENMPSAYTLLPSEKYFSDVFDPVIEFESDVSEIYDFPSLYGNSIDSKNELERFALGDSGGRMKPATEDTDSPNILNQTLLDRASVIQQSLDAWTAPEDINVVQIVGWGRDTIRGIRYDDCDILLCPDTLNHLDRELLWVDDGDGTVVVPSANAMDGVETYYVNLKDHNKELFANLRRNREHADILEVEPVQTLIENIIKGNATTTLPNHITTTKPPADEDARLRFRIHSPVSLDLYDADGNHTGLVATTSDFRRFEAQIPNSYYTEFGEVKYAGADGSPTNVVLIGEDSGTFTLEIEEVQSNEVTASSTFTDIPVVEGARATVAVVDLADAPSLVLDIDNDGTGDATVGSGEGISMEEMTDILRGIIKTLGLSPQKQARFDKIFDTIDKTLVKEQKCGDKKKKDKCEYKTKQKIDRTLGKLSTFIQKMSQGKKAVLTVEEAAEVLEIIEKIRSSIGI